MREPRQVLNVLFVPFSENRTSDPLARLIDMSSHRFARVGNDSLADSAVCSTFPAVNQTEVLPLRDLSAKSGVIAPTR